MENLLNKNEFLGIKSACLRTLLGLYKKANAGHIGASLSCLDILIYLFFYRMNPNDRFILSKGHAAVALYTVLEKAGKISKKELETFYKEGTLLAAHPPCSKKLNGVTFGTGSLGHGLSLASGMALSTKFNKSKFDVYCVISDGDCDEGSTWEAALFAAQHKLRNVYVIMDNNGLQGFGRAKEVINMEPLDKKWMSFNFDVAVAKNGNNFDCLYKTFNEIDKNKSGKPKCIIARTTKGSGVSFMENKMEWHYLPMTDEQYQVAMKEIGDSNA